MGLPLNFKVIGSTVAASALGMTLVIGAVMIAADWRGAWLSLAFLAFGVASGWLLGILVSPYTVREGTRFPQYASTLSAFASGYLVSKLDKVLEELLNAQTLSAPEVAFRVVASVTALIVSTVITYVYRAYVR